MGKKVGFECILYRGTAGSAPSTVVKGVTIVTTNIEKTQIDMTARGDKWKRYKSGVIDGSLEFELFYDPENEDFIAFQNAFFDGTAISVMAADDDGAGLDGDWEVFNFSIPQELEEGVKVSVTLKPSCDGREPAWTTVAVSNPDA